MTSLIRTTPDKDRKFGETLNSETLKLSSHYSYTADTFNKRDLNIRIGFWSPLDYSFNTEHPEMGLVSIWAPMS